MYLSIVTFLEMRMFFRGPPHIRSCFSTPCFSNFRKLYASTCVRCQQDVSSSVAFNHQRSQMLRISDCTQPANFRHTFLSRHRISSLCESSLQRWTIPDGNPKIMTSSYAVPCLLTTLAFYSSEGGKPDNAQSQASTKGTVGLNVWRQFSVRLKDAYKKYGYLLIGIHVAVCITWFYLLYLVASSPSSLEFVRKYLKRAPYMEEDTVNKIVDSKAGPFSVALLLYKIASPLRYTCTLLATYGAVRLLRPFGYFKPMPRGTFKAFVSEGREIFKSRRVARRNARRLRAQAGRTRLAAFRAKWKSRRSNSGRK